MEQESEVVLQSLAFCPVSIHVYLADKQEEMKKP